MMLDGYSISERKIIVFNEDYGFDTQDQIQPNGIDLRVNKIYRVHGKVVIPREGKAQADLQVETLELKEAYWQLEARDPAMFYVDFFENVDIPERYCGIIHTRSSLVRSGIDVVAGLYDSGFKGLAGGVLRIHNDIKLEYGAKLAQMTLVESKFRGHLYAGRYLNSNSQTAINELR